MWGKLVKQACENDMPKSPCFMVLIKEDRNLSVCFSKNIQTKANGYFREKLRDEKQKSGKKVQGGPTELYSKS